MTTSHLPNASAVWHRPRVNAESGAPPRLTAADVRPWTASSRRDTGARWDLLLVCLAGYVLISVGRVHQLFALEPLHLASLTGGCALLLYAVDRTDLRRSTVLWLPTTRYVLALLLWMVVSTPGSLSEGTSFTLVFGNFSKTVLMYFVMASAVRGVRDVERLAFAYVMAAAVYALVVVTRFDLGAGADWRLGHLYYYDANDFATFAVTATPLTLYFLHRARRPAVRVLPVGVLAVLMLAFVYSGSRGGFLALIAVAAYIVLCYTRIPLRWRVSATALVTLVLLGTASEQYWRQMSSIFSDADYNRTGETGRLQIWSRGVDYMLDHPILGVGPDNFPVAEGTLSPHAAREQYGVGVRWSAAHNAFIQVGAELGFPGLLLFVGMIASGFAALRSVRRIRRRTGTVGAGGAELSQALTASLLGFVVGSCFLSLAYSEMLYTLLALSVGLRKTIRTS